MSKRFWFAGMACKLRCPKCGGKSLHLAEEWDGNGIYFTVADGVMPAEADDHFQGGPVRVGATCSSCSHQWKVRGGVTGVDDLVVPEAASDTAHGVGK